MRSICTTVDQDKVLCLSDETGLCHSHDHHLEDLRITGKKCYCQCLQVLSIRSYIFYFKKNVQHCIMQHYVAALADSTSILIDA